MITDVCLVEPPERPRVNVGDIVTVFHTNHIFEQGPVEHIFSDGTVLLKGSDWPGPVIDRVTK